MEQSQGRHELCNGSEEDVLSPGGTCVEPRCERIFQGLLTAAIFHLDRPGLREQGRSTPWGGELAYERTGALSELHLKRLDRLEKRSALEPQLASRIFLPLENPVRFVFRERPPHFSTETES